MGRHSNWCRREQPSCICLTCMHDNPLDSTPCCSTNRTQYNPYDYACGVTECPAYECEAVEQRANHEERRDDSSGT